MPPPSRRRRRPAGTPDALKDHHQHAGNKPKSTGAQAAALIADVRFRRRVQHLERLGNRVAGELLARLAVQYGCLPMIEKFIDAAVENEPAIRAFGVDRWPPLPMRAVPR
jgi:hypothetical protein